MRALAEARALPSAELEPLRSRIAKARLMIERNPKLPREAKEEVMTNLQAEWEQYKQEIVREATQKATEQTLRESIQALCEVLAIPLDADRQRHIDSIDSTGLRALSAQIKLQRRWPA